jgi:4-amino-4-deoxychorismate lyase
VIDMLAILVDGAECANPAQAISVSDRGLNYGDGLFETMLLQCGRVRLLDAHLARLTEGCQRLRIDPPGDECLRGEIRRVCGATEEGVVKIVLTRGSTTRGYRAVPGIPPTRIVALHAPPPQGNDSIRARWCDMRLSRNAALAGIKHLNRLEQVLAQSEWNDPGIAEGLMLDSEGELVCATAANVFIVRGHEIATPDLRYCGVRGVMRGAVIRLAQALGIALHEEPLWPEDLEAASEVFLTSSVRGIRAVTALEHLSWPVGPVTQSLAKALEHDA